MRARFERQLKLTPDQKAKVDAIFQAGRQQMDQIYAEIRPRLEALRDSTSVQIRQLLTPEQQLKFDKLEAKRRQHFEERFGHPPSTPPEPEH
jgi:Spy/CpxP family protein refolding chaperone